MGILAYSVSSALTSTYWNTPQSIAFHQEDIYWPRIQSEVSDHSVSTIWACHTHTHTHDETRAALGQLLQ